MRSCAVEPDVRRAGRMTVLMIFESGSTRLTRRQMIRAAALVGGATLLTGRAAFAAQSGTPSLKGSKITLYNGQHSSTTKAIVKAFTAETGIDVQVRDGEDPELANQIVAEGDGSPADVVYTENSPALMLLSDKGLFAPVNDVTLKRVPEQDNSPKRDWVGVAGRSHVFLYNPARLPEAELPTSVMDLAQPQWKGKYGYAPAGGDFQPLVTAVIKLKGHDAALDWAKGLQKNGEIFQGNMAILKAVEAGQIAGGITLHYYWYAMARENGAGKMKSKLHFYGNQDPGALLVVSGAGALKSSKNPDAAQAFLQFLVSANGQKALVDAGDFEYPLAEGSKGQPELKPFDQLDPPAVGPGDLGDGRAAVELLQEAGIL